MKDLRFVYLRKYEDESDLKFELRVSKELNSIAHNNDIVNYTVTENSVTVSYLIISEKKEKEIKIKGFKSRNN